MQRLFLRRPSGAMVVAIIALVVAVSGSAVAATKIAKSVNGDKLIAKRTLSGNRLRPHTITGTQIRAHALTAKQINLKKLGKVPSAAVADRATSAAIATSALNANTASNAAELNGQPGSNFLTTSSRIGTNGIVRTAASGAGVTTTLFTVGPFTVLMSCQSTGGGTSLTLRASSSEASSVIDGKIVPANTQVAPTGLDIPATSTATANPSKTIDFEAPSGAQAVVAGADGVNSLGADCWANFAGIH